MSQVSRAVPTTQSEVNGLAVQVDEPPAEPRATVLIVPPFGVSADSLFIASYILSQNGFRAVRFDPRDHVGHSPGSIHDYRMSQVVDDLTGMLDHYRPDVVVGFSLAAPAVLRGLARWSGRAPAVLVAPVVNMRYTLNAVLDTDLFTVVPPDVVTVLGEDVRGRNFIEDCAEHGIVEFEHSVGDAEHVPEELVLVAGTEDPWVSFAEVEETARRRSRTSSAGGTTVLPVAVGTHQFNLNPTIAMTYMKYVLSACLRLVGAKPDEGRVPPLHESISAHRAMMIGARRAQAAEVAE